EVVRCSLETHFGRPSDPGVSDMLRGPTHVGSCAVERRAVREGDGRALFGLLVATSMFQWRPDAQIPRALQGIGREATAEISDSTRLLALLHVGDCPMPVILPAISSTCVPLPQPGQTLRLRKRCLTDCLGATSYPAQPDGEAPPVPSICPENHL